jgi:hypothetical protein
MIFLMRATSLTHVMIFDRRSLRMFGDAPPYAILPSHLSLQPLRSKFSSRHPQPTFTDRTSGHDTVLQMFVRPPLYEYLWVHQSSILKTPGVNGPEREASYSATFLLLLTHLFNPLKTRLSSCTY